MYLKRTYVPFVVVFGTLCAGQLLAQEPMGTAFTYQGQLKQAGTPINGLTDLAFTLWDAVSGGDQVGWTVMIREVDVVDGLFTVPLDFGGGAFSGDARWLEVVVTYPSGSGTPTTLSPRQPVTGAPYALYALSASGFWAANGDDIHSTNAGDVGIGTTTPAATLDVINAGGQTAISGTSPWIGVYGIHNSTTGTFPGVWGETDSLATGAAGVRGRVTSTNPGSLSAGVYGINAGTGSNGVGVRGGHAGGGAGIYGTSELGEGGHFEITNASNDEAAVYGSTTGTGTAGQFVYNNTGSPGTGILATCNGPTGSAAVSGLAIMGAAHAVTGTATGTGRAGVFQIINGSSSAPALYCSTTGTGPAFEANGTARVDVLEIMGADLAEKFPVSEEVGPGMVVAIDTEHPGKLCLARGAYNRCVAGVVSGAGDLPVGAVLGRLPGHEDAPPIALSGRVWVYCDATEQPIEPGNLLTSSETAGHAMKASDRARSHGATIGKAMTGLESGRGLVLVLVNLH